MKALLAALGRTSTNLRSLGRVALIAGAAGISSVFLGCSESGRDSAGGGAVLPDQVDFNEHIRPIFTSHCTSCHGGVKKAGDLSFVYQSIAYGAGKSGKRAIVPGSPGNSELMRRITSTDSTYRMPPVGHGEALSEREIELLERWIRQGAQWKEHWAYVAPREQTAPKTERAEWAANEIDAFLLHKLEQNGLEPGKPADPARLYRRLSLDVTGLPPSTEQLEAYLADSSEDAYEKAVDRLLDSPRFGERWASMWLDLARYADSVGYERDKKREIWAYRDWVIQALNEDLPFDQFTQKQLAGDLLPQRTAEDLIATAFHRNSKTNIEGGSDDEEFRIAATLDRVNTTWQTWMGTTFSCVQCHAHPYDPFPHESYYQFLSLFNNTEDFDTSDDFPTLRVAVEMANRGSISELQQKAQEAESRYMQPFQRLSESAAWTPLEYATATSTEDVSLSILRDERRGIYLQTGPDAPKGTIHTTTAPLPGDELTALRIDSFVHETKGDSDPDDPFVLSYIEAYVIDADGSETPVTFHHVVADQANQRLWPADSLDKESSRGWGAYPKQIYDRWAVFVPEEAVTLPPRASIKIVLHHNETHDGAQQPVLRRFKLSIDDDPEWTRIARDRDTLAALKTRRDLWAEVGESDSTTVPIMRERAEGRRRETRVFTRGDWLDKGETVSPALPPFMAKSYDEPIDDRLEMARWLVSPENPLTARVLVNRIWEQLFGIGIVETLEDFGSSGLPPSHPELLDFLALKLQSDYQWRLKTLIREIVRTSAYRQSDFATAEKRQKDPRNRLLGRGPRNRLTAEMIRDNALLVSGLLSDELYGPPVMPPQPEGIWRNVWNDQVWETSEGAAKHRRAIYTYWKRTTPYPSFMTFDAPSRDLCSPRRITTNTPLQALVTLNDPVYLECAANLARLSMGEGVEPRRWVENAWYRALLRKPDAADVTSLVGLYQDSLSRFEADPQLAAELSDSKEGAAMTLVANAIMNLDEFLTR